MTTSTAPSPKRAKTQSTSNDMMKYIAEMNERINYLTETINAQTQSLKEHEDVIGKLRGRMGI